VLDTAERTAEQELRAFAQANDESLCAVLNEETAAATRAMLSSLEAALEEHEHVRQLAARAQAWLRLTSRATTDRLDPVAEHALPGVEPTIRAIASRAPEELAPLVPAPGAVVVEVESEVSAA